MALPVDALLFRVPDSLDKVLTRDLAAAGIVKRDAAGRCLDIHALRHTYGTLLNAAGADVKTVQSLMRHATPAMTFDVYVHSDKAREARALEALPDMTPAIPIQKREALAAGAEANRTLVGLLVGADALSSENRSIPALSSAPAAASANQQKAPESAAKPHDSGAEGWWSLKELNLRPPQCECGALTN